MSKLHHGLVGLLLLTALAGSAESRGFVPPPASGGGGGSTDAATLGYTPAAGADPGSAADALDDLRSRTATIEGAYAGIQTLTHTTGSLFGSSGGMDPSEEYEDVNLALPSDNVMIVGVAIELTAGLSTSVSAFTYNTDAFSTVQTSLFGSSFGSGESINPPNPVFGPRINAGASSNSLAVLYTDYDGTHEMHLRVKNADFTGSNVGTFTITIRYIDIGSYP